MGAEIAARLALLSISPAAITATKVTFNTMVFKIKKEERQEMASVFDRPKPYVLNSLLVNTATEKNLTARVFHADKTRGKGVPAAKTLRTQILGGDRTQKRMELALRFHGMRRNEVAVPAKSFRTDRYGNVGVGILRQALASLRANDGEFFVPTRHGGRGLWPGVWFRTGGGDDGRGIAPLFLFMPKSNYDQKYDFTGVAEREVNRLMLAIWDREFGKALRNPRRVRLA
ncbi:MAG: hypothetical protein JRE23_14985 [Deltaproteobacteria bacterium]|nr:hypothetical protein [Deltaproteobacteria bacterium]